MLKLQSFLFPHLMLLSKTYICLPLHSTTAALISKSTHTKNSLVLFHIALWFSMCGCESILWMPVCFLANLPLALFIKQVILISISRCCIHLVVTLWDIIQFNPIWQPHKESCFCEAYSVFAVCKLIMCFMYVSGGRQNNVAFCVFQVTLSCG